MLLIYILTNKPKKPALIVLGISFVLFIIGLSMDSPAPPSGPAAHNEELNPETKIELSQQKFAEGMEYLNKNEYEKAISLFEQVIEEDIENYQVAQNYIKETKKLLSYKLLEDARSFFNKENYKEAIKVAEKAVALNDEIKNEANSLIEEATEKHETALLDKKKKEIIEKMKEWEGTGKARVAVSDVIAMSSFSDGFTTWKPKDPNNTWFLLVGVGVVNASQSTLHVNPNYATLICNNQAFNPDINTYSMNNYLDAIDLQPGTYTTGWLLFLVPKAETYTLFYEGMFDKTVKKEIIVTKIK